MIFLIEYDRKDGQIIKFEKFSDADQQKARDTRLKLELDLLRAGIEHEVVILEAASEEALRKTHRRYFENLSELVASAATGIEVH